MWSKIKAVSNNLSFFSAWLQHELQIYSLKSQVKAQRMKWIIPYSFQNKNQEIILVILAILWGQINMHLHIDVLSILVCDCTNQPAAIIWITSLIVARWRNYSCFEAVNVAYAKNEGVLPCLKKTTLKLCFYWAPQDGMSWLLSSSPMGGSFHGRDSFLFPALTGIFDSTREGKTPSIFSYAKCATLHISCNTLSLK